MHPLLQFTLDLFDPAPAGRPGAPPPPKRLKPGAPLQPTRTRRAKPLKAAPEPQESPKLAFWEPKVPVVTESIAYFAINNLADERRVDGLVDTAIQRPSSHLPEQTLAQALAPATFNHPQASRHTLLDDARLGKVLVGYAFRRGKRRTIGFSVGADGLTVSAPQWVALHEIDKSVLEKSGWIIEKLQETRARHERLESARIDWKNGCSLLFLGQPITVRLDARHTFGGVGAELRHLPVAAAQPLGASLEAVASLTPELHLGLPLSATPEQIRDVAQAWLMRQAKRIFIERLTHFAPQLGVQWRKLSLSSAGTRWGSASADGSIRLNWRLVHFKQNVLDYVVVHELSHLRVMDHSPRFWDTVRTVVPDYADLRSQLKDEGVPRW